MPMAARVLTCTGARAGNESTLMMWNAEVVLGDAGETCPGMGPSARSSARLHWQAAVTAQQGGKWHGGWSLMLC